MALSLYYDALSPVCRAVYLFLIGSGVDFEPKVIDVNKGEQSNPEFTKKHPFSQVPLIVDDGFALTESVAIMCYIATKYKVQDHWFPRQDVQQAARLDEFLNWQHLCLFKPMRDLVVEMSRSRFELLGRLNKKDPDKNLVTSAKESLSTAVSQIADYFLKDRSYICGDNISAADLIGVCALLQLGSVNESDIYEKNTTITKWAKRVGDRMAPHFEAVHRKLEQTTNKFNE